MKDPNQIADDARNSLSYFCIDVCKAQCCRREYLDLEKNEVDLVTQNRSEELKEKGSLMETEKGELIMHMGSIEGGCPSLKNNMCTIHKDKKRPKTCGDYPLFIEGDTYRLSQSCLAVQEGKYDETEKELIKAGLKKREDPTPNVTLKNNL